MKITATPIADVDLMPGDLYSALDQDWWDLVSRGSVSERSDVHICVGPQDANRRVYRITIGDGKPAAFVEPVAEEPAPPPSYASDFAGWLKERMRTHGDSVDDLAAHLSRTKGFVSNLRNGRSKPSPEIAGALAEHYGVDAETLKFWACGFAADLKQIIDGFPKASKAVIGS